MGVNLQFTQSSGVVTSRGFREELQQSETFSSAAGATTSEGHDSLLHCIVLIFIDLYLPRRALEAGRHQDRQYQESSLYVQLPLRLTVTYLIRVTRYVCFHLEFRTIVYVV
jgi:hypothetical protein